MQVYSPSQTESYTQCQMKRELRKWKPKNMGKPGIAAAMGTAMAKGLECYNHGRMTQGTSIREQVHEACLTDFAAEIEHFRQAGGVVMDETHDRLPSLMTRGLDYYAANDPIPQSWKIVGVEYAIEDPSNPNSKGSRMDMVIENDYGFAPVDHKWKESLYVRNGETKDAARFRTLLDYKDSWKMLHYVWAVRKAFGRCNGYYIILGELGPRPNVKMQRFEVDDEKMQWWEQSAWQYWEDMRATDEGDRIPAMAGIHETKYGKCEYWKACMEHKLHPELMAFDYVQVERRN